MRKVYTKDLQVGDIIADFDTDRTVVDIDHDKIHTKVVLQTPENGKLLYIFYPSQSHQVRDVVPKRRFELEPFWHVISEPGDATRYDFYLHRIGTDIIIMQGDSNFPYPAYLPVHLLHDLIVVGSPANGRTAIEHKCNQHTVAEVAAAAIEIFHIERMKK